MTVNPNLWISLAGNADGPDAYARPPEYCAAPAKYVSRCFAMAKRARMNLILAQPSGYRENLYKVNPGDYRAGVFRDDEANRQFLIERDIWKANGVQLACGLYMGHWITDTVAFDPANKQTQDFMRGPLAPFLVPGFILGVDAIMPSAAAAQRLSDACACFGVKFYQEGLPYGRFPGTIPSLGTMVQQLVVDPGFTKKVPAGLDMRLRVGFGDIGTGPNQYPADKYKAAMALAMASGYGLDALSWVGDPQLDQIVAIAAAPTGAEVTS